MVELAELFEVSRPTMYRVLERAPDRHREHQELISQRSLTSTVGARNNVLTAPTGCLVCVPSTT
ncbi:hypothetical protein [Actinoplanes sp. NPDC026623]|uniref:hypothetical protein n=1 Tax=Actinoplanes sp. NPDC026623 TaxID=3155610 RepID=UPI0033D81E56